MTEKITPATGDGSVSGLFVPGAAGRPLLVRIPGGSHNARYHTGVQYRADVLDRAQGLTD